MSLRAKLAALPVPAMTRFVAVVSIAIAAGHLVQTLAADKPAPSALALAEVLPTHIVQLSSGGLAEADRVMPNPESHLMVIEKPSVQPLCPVDLALTAHPGGMIEVSLLAPCRRTERVVLRQAALAVTAKVGTDGMMTVLLPALTPDGAVSVLFSDGSRVENAVAVTEAARLRRFGVQWQGVDGFALHAFENGSDFDQPGDISHNNRGDGRLPGDGFLSVLGDASVDNPLLAEIYTYPVTSAQTPDIVVEAAVLPETCGQDLLGEVLTSGSGNVVATDLTLAMPDCSGIGDFLVLKNLASDVKIAAR